MSKEVTITRVKNGYILESDELCRESQVFLTLESLFNELLFLFEGRSAVFGGSEYGKVVILGMEEVMMETTTWEEAAEGKVSFVKGQKPTVR